MNLFNRFDWHKQEGSPPTRLWAKAELEERKGERFLFNGLQNGWHAHEAIIREVSPSGQWIYIVCELFNGGTQWVNQKHLTTIDECLEE